MDCWIALYFQHGRFPGSQKLIATPQVKAPYFLKTNITISPVDLYKKFAGSDAKALVPIQALAALNIHFRGNKYTSQDAIRKYLQNLTFQTLSQENDKVYLYFGRIAPLANDLRESIVKTENEKIDKTSILSEQIQQRLDGKFKPEISPEIKIQRGEEIPKLPEVVQSSTPLKKEEIEEIYQKEKEDFLKTAIKINKTDLETAMLLKIAINLLLMK